MAWPQAPRCCEEKDGDESKAWGKEGGCGRTKGKTGERVGVSNGRGGAPCANKRAGEIVGGPCDASGGHCGCHGRQSPCEQLHGHRLGGLYRFPESREFGRNRPSKVARESGVPHLAGNRSRSV